MKHRKKRNKSSSASSTSTKWKVASERKIINTQLKIQEVTRWDIWAWKKKREKRKATISVVVSSPPQGAVYPEGYWRVRGVKINQLTSSHKQPLQLCYKETYGLTFNQGWRRFSLGQERFHVLFLGLPNLFSHPCSLWLVYLQREIFMELNHKYWKEELLPVHKHHVITKQVSRLQFDQVSIADTDLW